MRIRIVPPGNELQSTGNWRTAQRYARLLSDHETSVSSVVDGEDFDIAFILHAIKGFPHLAWLQRERPAVRRVVVLTGTDIYGDSDCRPAFESAHGIVALQEDACSRIPDEFRSKASTIYQSARPSGELDDSRPGLWIGVVANLRDVKDPLRVVHAVNSLGDDPDCRLVLVGAEIDEPLTTETRSLDREHGWFQWVGPKTEEETRDMLRSSDVVVIPSLVEGSSNVLMECLIDGIPVLASRIPGLVGTLGEDYPGLFEPGSSKDLARLLERCTCEPEFLSELRQAGMALRHLASEECERKALETLVSAL